MFDFCFTFFPCKVKLVFQHLLHFVSVGFRQVNTSSHQEYSREMICRLHASELADFVILRMLHIGKPALSEEKQTNGE